MNLLSSITNQSRSYKMYGSRLEKLGIATVSDMLFHVPSRYDDFSLISKISEVQPGEIVTLQGTVEEIENVYTRSRMKIQRATLADETGSIDLTWFNQPFLIKYISKGDKLSVSGKVETFARKTVIQSPEYEVIAQSNVEEHTLHTGRLVPIYPETKGVTSKWLRRQIYGLLKQYQDELQEYLPSELIKKHRFISLYEAVHQIHFPTSLDEAKRARERLAFDELLLVQLRAIHRRRRWQEKIRGNAFTIDTYQDQISKFIGSLPFQLTNAQDRAVQSILKDIKQNKPMNRMLQGDVGSGKTVVAAIGMYVAYLNGFQSALMAPTEILATQHYQTLSRILSPFGIKVDLLTGSKNTGIMKQESGGKKNKTKNHDSSFMIHDSHILVGTHALLTKNITFDNLGFITIDEQQRFGVEQRGIIREKGNNPHILTMTATPIPRTVALTMYGDLDLSYLDEMPQGRKRIKTWLVPKEKRNNAYEWIRKEIHKWKSQAFIICPLIEESENMITVRAATKEYEYLSKEVFPDLKLSLLHGRQKSKEKDEVLKAFRERKADILVATPVVEVGIDIPNATIIVIEAADRFGLAQLHQLRGRVGRGDLQSYCLLFTESEGENAIKRLKAMETISVGHELAELDLRLRGPGDMYGTMQHGRQELKIASFSDLILIEKARNDAQNLFEEIEKYPQIQQKLEETEQKKISPD